jgi:hypothetical protein
MNITSLLLLFYFIFATLGTQLFATVRYNDHEPGGALGDRANFNYQMRP